ncbi:MAG: glycosyltransferase family 2 protein [Chloroflexi bacterium]|nr:glycosyltransferase family 2 protein [Chloroflexota bacterium]
MKHAAPPPVDGTGTAQRVDGVEGTHRADAAVGGERQESVRPTISVVAPAWNEAPTLPEFYRQVAAVLDEMSEPWELILVDDGSADSTRSIIRELHARDLRVKGISFSKNFGHQVAITAGLDHARGDAVVVIDSDLQDPPHVIPELVARWREGYQVVYAQRAARVGETWFKRVTASLFYRLIRRISNVDIPVDTGDFRLLDRRAVDALRSMREHHRYVRGMAAWIGFRSIGVPYHRAARHAGETKYPLRRMIKFALDGITNFSYLPLQLATYAGFLVAGLSLIGIFIAVVLRLFLGHALTGQATTLVSVLFLGGIQLIFLGIIGEYLGRIYDEVKRRPLYIVDDAVGFAPRGADRRTHDSPGTAGGRIEREWPDGHP